MILKICLGLKMWTSLCWNKLKNAIVYDLMNIWSPFVFYVPSAFARRNAIFLALIATSICICPFSLPYLILRYIRLVVIAPPSNLELYGSIMTLGGKAIGGRGGGVLLVIVLVEWGNVEVLDLTFAFFLPVNLRTNIHCANLMNRSK